MMAVAICAGSLASCEDVPSPYDNPNDKKSEVVPGTYLDEALTQSLGSFQAITTKGLGWKIDHNAATATGYDRTSRTNQESESYLVSPVVDLRNSKEASLQFNYIVAYGQRNSTLRVLVSKKYTGNPSTTDWTDITGTLTMPSTVDWNNFDTYAHNLDASNLGDTLRVAFHFAAPATESRTWEIKSVVLKEGRVETDTPNVTPTSEKGDGSQANPYNTLAMVNKLKSLKADSVVNDLYVTGIVSSDPKIDTGNYGNANFDISDDGTATNALKIFRVFDLNNKKFTSANAIAKGDTVVITGSFTNYKGNTPETLGSKAYIYSIKKVSGNSNNNSNNNNKPAPASSAVVIDGTTLTLNNVGVEAGTETVTIDLGTALTDASDLKNIALSDGSVLVFNDNGEKYPPKFYDKSKGVRVYANTGFTITGKKTIAKIVITCDSYSGTNYTGDAGATVVFDGTTATYKNVSQAGAKPTQLRAQTITITYVK